MIGGGAGHIADMISRMKSNLSFLKKKNYFNAISPYTKYNKNLQFKNTSKEELDAIKEKIKTEQKIESRNKTIVILIFILLTSLIFYVLFYFLN